MTEYDCGAFSCLVLSDGTAEIVNYSGDDRTLEIPASLGGRTVSRIGPYAFEGMAMSCVIVPYGVESLGYMAFSNCQSLASVRLAESVTEIGEGAFSGCVSLREALLPLLARYGEGAFDACPCDVSHLSEEIGRFKAEGKTGWVFFSEGHLPRIVDGIVRLNEGNLRSFNEANDLQLRIGDVVEKFSIMLGWAGRPCASMCIRRCSDDLMGKAFIRYHASGTFMRDYIRNIGPYAAHMDFSFLNQPEDVHRIDVHLGNPDPESDWMFNWLFGRDIIKTELWFYLTEGEYTLEKQAVKGQDRWSDAPYQWFIKGGNASFFGFVSGIDRKEETFELFVKGLGCVHFSLDVQVLETLRPGEWVRICVSPYNHEMYIDYEKTESLGFPSGVNEANARAALDILYQRLKEQLSDVPQAQD